MRIGVRLGFKFDTHANDNYGMSAILDTGSLKVIRLNKEWSTCSELSAPITRGQITSTRQLGDTPKKRLGGMLFTRSRGDQGDQ